jgi:hypothetical protein
MRQSRTYALYGDIARKVGSYLAESETRETELYFPDEVNEKCSQRLIINLDGTILSLFRATPTRQASSLTVHGESGNSIEEYVTGIEKDIGQRIR